MLCPRPWLGALQALPRLPRLSTQHRSFSITPNLPAKPLPPRLKINDADLTVSYLKGTGPGGQKINKTNSAVQIIHHPSGIVVKCQATRSRSQNAKTARSLLADKIEQKEKGGGSRVALKAEIAKKKKASKMKKTRRKYRELEGKEGEVHEEELEEAEEGSEEVQAVPKVGGSGEMTGEKGPAS
ncbi:peptide chain release factor-like protein [Penicillium pulvis]|uniref:peptide chain release factor-like protein n=1 Tax=Penicillium pulvis TaxID=1562058 RepID=UPI002547AA4A|nr:peptide chain release factor-like protein [Penicillium pulvis]KAJ5809256.1 peptide chain release factor-like protein [Penicillium pulvis]